MAFNRNSISIIIKAKDEASKVLNKVHGNLQKHARAYSQAGNKMLIASTALTAGIGVAINQAAKFQKQMAQVATMLDSHSKKFLPDMQKAVKNMAIEYGESTEALANGLYDILSASIDASKATEVLEVAVKAAKAGLTDAGTAADAITTVINSYGLEAKDAADVSDLLFSIVKRGKLTFADLAPNIGNVAALAAKANISLEDLGATIATLTRSGVRTERAMTAVRGIINAMIGPTKTQADLFRDKLGVAMDTTTLKAEGVVGVLNRIKAAGLSEKELAAMFPNIRALSGVITAMGDLEGITKDVAIMTNRAGAATKAFNTNTNTTVDTFKKFHQSIKVLLAELGETLLPIVNKMIEGMTKIVQWIRSWDEGTKKLVMTVGAITAGLLALSGIILKVMGLVGTATTGIVALAGAFGATTTASAALASALGTVGLVGVLGLVAVATQKAINLMYKLIKVDQQKFVSMKKADRMQKLAAVSMNKYFEKMKANIDDTSPLKKHVDKIDEIRATYGRMAADGRTSAESLKVHQELLFKKIRELSDEYNKQEHVIAKKAQAVQAANEKEAISVKDLTDKEKQMYQDLQNEIVAMRGTELQQRLFQLEQEKMAEEEKLAGEIENKQKLNLFKTELDTLYEEKRKEIKQQAADENAKKAAEELARAATVKHSIDLLGKSETEQKKLQLKKQEEDLIKSFKKSVKFTKEHEDTVKKIKAYYKKQEENLDEELAKNKQLKALQTAEFSIQAITTLLQAEGDANKKRKQFVLYLIGLEKALAIARAWRSAAGSGPLAIAQAAATTATIVAQFAGIYRSVKKAKEPSAGFKTPELAQPDEIASEGFSTVDRGTTSEGFTASSGTTGGVGGGGVAAGGGAVQASKIININVGGVSVNFDVDNLGEVQNNTFEQFLRDIGEAMKSRTVEAVQVALRTYNLGKELEEEAV